MQLLVQTAFMPKAKGTISIQISVTPSAKAAVDRIAGRTEIPQKRVLSKIYEWFAKLPDPAQKSILWPEEEADDVAAIMIALEYLAERQLALASSAPANGSPEQRSRLADLRSRASTKLRALRETTPNTIPEVLSPPNPPRSPQLPSPQSK